MRIRFAAGWIARLVEDINGMTFSGLFSGFKKVLSAEHQLAPILGLIPVLGPIVTAADPWVNRLIGAMGSAEVGSPVGNGSLKEATVIADFEAGMDVAQAALAVSGKRLTYDAAKLKAAIADLNKGLSELAEVKASFKIEDLPK